MVKDWQKNVWSIPAGDGIGLQPAGATCYRGLTKWTTQKLETQLHTGSLSSEVRAKVRKLLTEGHALYHDAERYIANMLLEHVVEGQFDYRVWYVRPNEVGLWVGDQVWDVKSEL
jgi:hypothetical protein